jgi:drug/metabolite transporter (DMT)-like permease
MDAQAPPSRGWMASRMLACSMLWSSGFLFMKLAVAVSPWLVSASRAGIAAAAISGWLLLRGRSPVPRPEERVPWLVLGTLNGWLPNVLTAYAVAQIAAGFASMIQASGPIMVAVIAHFAFAEERLTGRRIFGVAVGFLGMAVLIGPAALDPGGGALGIGAMLWVSLCYALGNIYARNLKHIEPIRLALGQQSVSALVSIVLTAAFVGAAAVPSFIDNWAALLALGLVGTAIPITIFMSLIQRTGPTRAAMIGYLMPVWATLLAMVFLGETVGLREVAGAAIVLTGVWVVTTAPRGD